MSFTYDPRLSYSHRVKVLADAVAKPALKDLYLRAMASVDWHRIEAIRTKHAAQLVDFDPGSKLKYLDVPYWTWLRLTEVRNIGLDLSSPKRILDLGCGCAHFALLLRALGHSYVGTDIDEPFYIEMCEALEINRISHCIDRNKALPDFGGPFDLVTAFDICFNYVGTVPGKEGFNGNRIVYFSAQDWTNFLNDLCGQMKYSGRIFFIPNQRLRLDGSYGHEPELLTHFQNIGAKPQIKFRSITYDIAVSDFLIATAPARGGLSA